MNNVTEITRQKVDRWIRAKKEVEEKKERLALAEAELQSSIDDLGKWLVPNQTGQFEYNEPFNIWFGTGILQAVLHKGDVGRPPVYVVSWRKEPDGKDRLEYGV